MKINRLVVATRNNGKFKEIKALFKDTDIVLLSLNDFDSPPEIVEDGETFEENAMKKAKTVARWANLPALADDSGLEVDCLGGAPGVRSSRFASELALSDRKEHDRQNIRKLLDLLKGIHPEQKTARFRCVVVLALPDGTFWKTEGKCEGRIAEEPKGTAGFGYDPVFFLPHLGKTFGELTPKEKNTISHRGKAIALMKTELKEFI